MKRIWAIFLSIICIFAICGLFAFGFGGSTSNSLSGIGNYFRKGINRFIDWILDYDEDSNDDSIEDLIVYFNDTCDVNVTGKYLLVDSYSDYYVKVTATVNDTADVDVTSSATFDFDFSDFTYEDGCITTTGVVSAYDYVTLTVSYGDKSVNVYLCTNAEDETRWQTLDELSTAS